jgi:hypothetical protein
VLQVEDPQKFDPTPYERVLNQNFRRLHVCINCRSDIVIRPEMTPPSTHLYSVWGLGLLGFARQSNDRLTTYLAMLDETERIERLIGTKFLHSTGLLEPVNLEEAEEAVVVVANISILVVIALWLALKAHRRVLDYFSRSGALLPLVAATGRASFYGAIWTLTALRVVSFLLASVPILYFSLKDFSGKGMAEILFQNDYIAFCVWILSLAISLGYATFVASIAELRHRHSLLSFTYRYIPLLICAFGTLLWGLSFLFETQGAHFIRVVLVALPLLGMVPTLVAPVITPEYGFIAVNACLTFGLLVLAIRSNVRWFASHLEEL